MQDKVRIKQVIEIAGAFMAWVIGSGFATGQEVLQFYSSYGYKSFGVILINLIGFIAVGYFVMIAGYEHKEVAQFNPFRHFCGNKIGSFYTWLAAGTLMLLIPILIAGGGATLNEYYGINPYIGTGIMTGLVLAGYLIGFEKMVRIVSLLSPVIIIFSILVGVVTVFNDMGNWSAIPSYQNVLSPYQAAPHWFLSGLLYLGLNFFPSASYFSEIGCSGFSKKELKWGAVFGGLALLLSITIVNMAIMLNGNDAAGLEIPVLYLAGKISAVLGSVFSVVLVIGILASCSVTMWSVCSRFVFQRKILNKIAAIGVAVVAYFVSFFSFGKLVGIIYPLIGYVGLFYIASVIYKGSSHIRKENICVNRGTKDFR